MIYLLGVFMQVITLWNEKGGVGKTCLSLMLAGCASSKGLKTLLLDCDPQRSSIDLADDGNFPFEIRPQSLDRYELIEVIVKIERETPSLDLLIVDMPPNTNRFPEGVCITPYEPNRLSFATSVRHFESLKNHCDKFIEVVNKLDLRKSDHKEFMVGNHNLRVKSRSVYERVTNLGTTIFDPQCKNFSGGREARNEINILLSEALNEH